MLSKIFLTLVTLTFSQVTYAAEGQGGMPQLNPESFSSQIFWLIVFFLTLFLAIHFFFIPKLKKVRSERDETIEEYLSETKELNKQVEDIIKNIEEDLNKAKNIFDNEIKTISEENKKIFEKKIIEIDRDFENKKNLLNENLIKSEKKIIEKIPKICMDLSDQLYEKILGQKVKSNIKDFERVIKD